MLLGRSRPLIAVVLWSVRALLGIFFFPFLVFVLCCFRTRTKIRAVTAARPAVAKSGK